LKALVSFVMVSAGFDPAAFGAAAEQIDAVVRSGRTWLDNTAEAM
jgi:hypothetical protein